MALNEQYFVTSDLDTYFVDKDSGLPLAGGKVYFYSDINRTQAKNVYELSGSAADYTYDPLPNPVNVAEPNEVIGDLVTVLIRSTMPCNCFSVIRFIIVALIIHEAELLRGELSLSPLIIHATQADRSIIFTKTTILAILMQLNSSIK